MTLDVLITLLLAAGLFHGFTTGVVKQVASIFSMVAAFVIGMKLMHPIGGVISEWTGMSEGIAPILGFAVVFGLIHLGVFIVVKIVEKILGVLKLGFVNRLLGSGFGLFKAGIALSVAFLALGMAGFPGEETRENSVLYGVVEPLLPQTWDLLREYFPEVENLRDRFRENPTGESPQGDPPAGSSTSN